MTWLASLVVGVLFGAGLSLSGMMNPAKVLAFLDVTGSWDPSLLLVMAGAVGVTALFHRLILKRPSPLWDARWHLPTRRDVDGRLIVGAVVFGVGWGLAGICPGPAFAALLYGRWETWVFVGALAAGAMTHQRLHGRRS